MGMNHTRVIRCRLRCQPADVGVENGGDDAYRHRMVSNKPLIMNANATA